MNRIVLLTDGGIGSLVTASLILQDLSRTTPVLDRFTLGCQIEHFDDCPEFESSRKSCIEAQANLIDSTSTEFMPRNASLISVLARAIELAGPKGRLYWPVRCGVDTHLLQKTMDTVTALMRLNTIITDSPGPELILPLIDLGHEQVAELAGELDAPIQSGWPCRSSSVSPCRSCASCAAWDSALTAAGLILVPTEMSTDGP